MQEVKSYLVLNIRNAFNLKILVINTSLIKYYLILTTTYSLRISRQKSVGWDSCGREARFGLLKNLSMMREKVRYILLRNEIYLRSVTCGFPTSTLLSKVFTELQLFYYYSYLNTLSLLQATLTIVLSQFGKGNIFLTSKIQHNCKSDRFLPTQACIFYRQRLSLEE